MSTMTLFHSPASPFVRKVMVRDQAGNCIGCSACVRVCPKACQTHVKAGELGL